MTTLGAALEAFIREHEYCGDLDTGLEDDRVWMTCTCGAVSEQIYKACLRAKGWTWSTTRSRLPDAPPSVGSRTTSSSGTLSNRAESATFQRTDWYDLSFV
jgi:hypothetical protein